MAVREVKLDGYRALAIRSGSGVSLLSRRNRSLADQFPAIYEALNSLEEGAILDGEIVALDHTGKPSFNLLQNYASKSTTLVYYVFDQLAYRRKSLLSLPLQKRREVLAQTLSHLSEPIRHSAVLTAWAEQVIAAVKQQGLEGVVAKRSTSKYEAGHRSGQWVKFKTNQGQEFVVGGYRVGKNHFDNLAIGYYEGKRLLFIAKLKNGFTPAAKKVVYDRLKHLETAKCPFANLPESKDARRGEALTEEAMKNYRWVKPSLVVQAEFTDWTAANHLRHSRFLGLREDKEATKCIRRSSSVHARILVNAPYVLPSKGSFIMRLEHTSYKSHRMSPKASMMVSEIIFCAVQRLLRPTNWLSISQEATQRDMNALPTCRACSPWPLRATHKRMTSRASPSDRWAGLI